jgi:hypothetical protein
MKSTTRKIQVTFRVKPAGFAVPVKVLLPIRTLRRKPRFTAVDHLELASARR